MTETRGSGSNELVLSIGQYAYTQDTTSGAIKILTGPTVVNITGQEYPVVFNFETRQFDKVDLQRAAQQSPLAAQGSYIELSNPAMQDGRNKFPTKGKEGAVPVPRRYWVSSYSFPASEVHP